MLIDGTMRAKRVQIAGPAIILIDDAVNTVAHHQSGVSGWTIGDGCLHMNGHGQSVTQVGLDAVLGADEGVEADGTQATFEFVGGKARQKHRGVARDVLAQPLLIQVVTVQMRDVQVRRMKNLVAQRMRQLIVTREDEPRSEERGIEPRVAENGSLAGFDEDAGVTDGGGPHRGRSHDSKLPIHAGTNVGTMVTAWGDR